MKAVILAAGKGTRMRPLTFLRLKLLVTLLNKPLLHHIFDLLPEAITGVILVIRYKGDMIRNYFSNEFLEKKYLC